MQWPFRKADIVSRPPSENGAELALGGSVDIRQLNADLAREYIRSIYLWRCVDMIGAMAASVPLKVYKGDENSQLTRAELDVEQLLTRPNPQWNGHALQYYICVSLAVSNRAYLLRSAGTGNVTQQLWPLGVNEVTVV